MGKMSCLCFLVILMLSSTQGDHHIDHHHYNHQPQQNNPHPGHSHDNNAKHGEEHHHYWHHHHPHHPHLHDEDHEYDHKAHLLEEMLCRKIAPGNFDFAFRLFKTLASKPAEASKNIFFSPLCISTAFSMLSLGARANTLNQLMEGLGFNRAILSEFDIHHGFEHLLHMLNSYSEDLQLNNGNALFLKEGVKFYPRFLTDAKHYYDAEAFNTDFSKSGEAVKQINDYIKMKTHGKIVKALNGVDQDSVALLINYIFFKGKWDKPFDPKLTKEDNFFVNENVRVKVQMMQRTGRYHVNFDDNKEFIFVEIPYKQNVSMALILPEEGKMDTIIESLSKETVMKWRTKARTFLSDIQLYIPKFSARTSYSLHELLPEMGISEVFSDQADLSGIVKGTAIKISKAFHKAAIDCDEKGTDASAVTTLEAISRSFPLEVKVDRPFIVLICDPITESILFMGKVNNPVQSSDPK